MRKTDYFIKKWFWSKLQRRYWKV